MDLDQFRKIYSDFRLAESRAKANQYKAWDYSSQHMNMRAPPDKRQYDPRQEDAEELYYKEDQFKQIPRPKAHFSHLSTGIVGGITSSLAGKDYRDTSTKFVTYGELFNHIPMVPDVVNIVKQMLNPLQIDLFNESIRSINENANSPGLLLSVTLIEFIKKMTSTLLSTGDSLQNNDRRLYKDSLNRLTLLQGEQAFRTLPSKAAELLSRLAYSMWTLNKTKEDIFVSAITEPTVSTNNAANAEDMAAQNFLNANNSTRAQEQLNVRPLREIQPQLESINEQDYNEGGRLLANLFAVLEAQVSATIAPMPVLKSQASSAVKSSTVKTVDTDLKPASEKPQDNSLAGLLRKLIDQNERRERGEDGGDESSSDEDQPPGPPRTQPPPAATKPPTTTPQGPTLIIPNNATMVPTQPNATARVPRVNDIGEVIDDEGVLNETVVQEPETPVNKKDKTETVTVDGVALTGTEDELVNLIPIVAPDVVTGTYKDPVTGQTKVTTGNVTATYNPLTDQQRRTYAPVDNQSEIFDEAFIRKPWPEQWPELFKIPDTALKEIVLMTKTYPQLTYKEGNNNSIFYVDANSRLRLYQILKSLKDVEPAVLQPLVFVRKENGGLAKDDSQKTVFELVQAELAKTVKPALLNTTSSTSSEEIGTFPMVATSDGSVFFQGKRWIPDPNNPSRLISTGNGKKKRGRPRKDRSDDKSPEIKKTRVQDDLSLLASGSFLLPTQKANTPDILDLHKDDIVTSITVKRSPIPQFMEDMFETMSRGTWSQLKKKHGFDSFFHLAAVINDDILIEKNSNGINVAVYKPYESEEIKVPAKLLGKFTLGEMVDKVKSDMGQDFCSYHPFENNCQNFMFRFLKNSKSLTPQIAEFVSQPIENLVKDLPAYFSPMVKAAADVYGVVQPMLNPNP